MIDLDELSKKIAQTILSEEFADSDEKSRQDDVSREIKSQGLEAPEKKDGEKQPITDEGEDEGEEESKKDVKAKPAPVADAEDDVEEFEAELPSEIPSDPSVDDIVDQINNLRAGHSLKDGGTRKQLGDYFEKLGVGEERALYIFLSSLASILTGGATGEEAPRPETSGVDVNVKAAKKKVAAPGTPSVQPGGEQAPIMVGEVADTLNYKTMVLEAHGPGDKHRCLDGRLVKFGTRECLKDIKKRISDTEQLRNDCNNGSANRASLNGVLKFLRQKLRAANKIYINR